MRDLYIIPECFVDTSTEHLLLMKHRARSHYVIFVKPAMDGFILSQAAEAGIKVQDYGFPADYDFEAHKQLVPMQPGDVPVTYADSTALERDFGFTPKITLKEGLRKFAEWYAEYYGTKK